jgi:hypothetical protein
MVNQDSKGFKKFVNFMYDQLPAWSLGIVNDSIEAILSTKYLNNSDNGIINATVQADLFGDNRDECLDKIDSLFPIVKLANSNWSIVYFAICLNSDITQEAELSRSLSEKLGKKVIYFCANDTSLINGYRVFESGREIGEEFSWEQLDDLNFEVSDDDHTEILNVSDAIERSNEANFFLQTEGIFIPPCYVGGDESGNVYLMTTASSLTAIESVSLIPAPDCLA